MIIGMWIILQWRFDLLKKMHIVGDSIPDAITCCLNW